MPYALGIDLGSSHLVAAICRNDHERWSAPEVLELDGAPVTKAVLHLTDEGTVEVGDRALMQVTSRPDRVTRGVVDRVGDEIPITLGGHPYPAEVLIAAVVGWIADYAEAAEGMPASQLVVTHPAGWGSHRRATLLGALREVDLPELTLLPRPVAAAESYAATERIEVGQEIAVHSLGAGRFEAAVLRRGSFGFELRAHADSAETTGGDLFDDLLATRVLADLGHEVDPVPLAKLRAECRKAKERLSTELAVTVPAPARSPRGTVMVNRTDLEELIRPAVEATVTSLQRTILAAGTSTGSLRAVVLVGGSGRIPLVSELVSAGVRVHVAATPEPELAVARGAALAAARVAKPTVRAPALTHTPEPIATSAVTHTDLMRFDDVPAEELADVGPPPPRPPVEIAPLEPPKRRLLRLGTKSTADPDSDARPARRTRDLDDVDDPHSHAWDFDEDLDLRPPRRPRPTTPDDDLAPDHRRTAADFDDDLELGPRHPRGTTRDYDDDHGARSHRPHRTPDFNDDLDPRPQPRSTRGFDDDPDLRPRPPRDVPDFDDDLDHGSQPRSTPDFADDPGPRSRHPRSTNSAFADDPGGPRPRHPRGSVADHQDDPDSRPRHPRGSVADHQDDPDSRPRHPRGSVADHQDDPDSRPRRPRGTNPDHEPEPGLRHAEDDPRLRRTRDYEGGDPDPRSRRARGGPGDLEMGPAHDDDLIAEPDPPRRRGFASRRREAGEGLAAEPPRRPDRDAPPRRGGYENGPPDSPAAHLGPRIEAAARRSNGRHDTGRPPGPDDIEIPARRSGNANQPRHHEIPTHQSDWPNDLDRQHRRRPHDIETPARHGSHDNTNQPGHHDIPTHQSDWPNDLDPQHRRRPHNIKAPARHSSHDNTNQPGHHDIPTHQSDWPNDLDPQHRRRPHNIETPARHSSHDNANHETPARHEARPGDGEPRRGRRHRTDDRAFNESLSRARHADSEPADEPRRGRDLR